eukprot:gene337-969_t
MAGFSLRIVDADFYQKAPDTDLDICHAAFWDSDTRIVPVIRVFGATPNGQKACLHVHQVFPYIYVPISKREACEKFAKQFATSLNFALHVSLGKSASSIQNYVHQIDIVKGTTFYGYHEEEETFLKIQFYNPNLVNRLEELLLNGAIMNRVFQPYEAHIPYLLQFFIDYNLYGMNYIHLSQVKFRQPVFVLDDYSNSTGTLFKSPSCTRKMRSTPLSPVGSPAMSQTCYNIWNTESITPNSLLPTSIERQSTCMLEVDGIATNILNKNDIKGSLGTCPGLAAIWKEERIRRKENNEPDIPLPVSQDRLEIDLMDVEKRYLEQIKNIIEERKSLASNEVLENSYLEYFASASSTSEEPAVNSCNEEIDESQPIVNEDIIKQSILEPSASQLLSSPLDKELVALLAEPTQDSQPILSQLSAVSNISGISLLECDNEDEAEEDENETIVMSQHIFDDVDEECGEQEETERGSEIQLDGFEDSWSTSMLDNIPQLDGMFDIEDGPIKQRMVQMEQSPAVDKSSTSCRDGDPCLSVNMKETSVGFVKSCKDDEMMFDDDTTSRVKCNCPRVGSSERIRVREYVRSRFKTVIPQLDGSSDTDFPDSSNVFSKSRKNRTDVSRTRERPPASTRRNLRARNEGRNKEKFDRKMSQEEASGQLPVPTKSSTEQSDGCARNYEVFTSQSEALVGCEAVGNDIKAPGNLSANKDGSSFPELDDAMISLYRAEHSSQSPRKKGLQFTSSVGKSESPRRRKKRERASLVKLGFIDFSTSKSKDTALDTQRDMTSVHSSLNSSQNRPDRSTSHATSTTTSQSDCCTVNFVPDPVKEVRPVAFKGNNVDGQSNNGNKVDGARRKSLLNVDVITESDSADQLDFSSTDYDDFKYSFERRSRKRLSTLNIAEKSKRIRFEEVSNESRNKVLSFYKGFEGILLTNKTSNVDCGTCCDALFKFRYASPERLERESKSSPPRPTSPSETDTIVGASLEKLGGIMERSLTSQSLCIAEDRSTDVTDLMHTSGDMVQVHDASTVHTSTTAGGTPAVCESPLSTNSFCGQSDWHSKSALSPVCVSHAAPRIKRTGNLSMRRARGASAYSYKEKGTRSRLHRSAKQAGIETRRDESVKYEWLEDLSRVTRPCVVKIERLGAKALRSTVEKEGTATESENINENSSMVAESSFHASPVDVEIDLVQRQSGSQNLQPTLVAPTELEETITRLTPLLKPPSGARLMETAYEYNLGETQHQKAFCSNATDLPVQVSKVGGRFLRIKSKKVSELAKFDIGSGFQGSLESMQRDAIMNTSLYKAINNEDQVGFGMSESDFKRVLTSERKVRLTPCHKPPSQSSIKGWLEEKEAQKTNNMKQHQNSDHIERQEPQDASETIDSPVDNSSSFLNCSNTSNTSHIEKSAIPKPFAKDHITKGVSQQNLRLSPTAGPISSTPLAANRISQLKLPLTPGLRFKSNKDSLLTPTNRKSSGIQSSSQIEGPTPTNSFGFGFTQVNYQDAKSIHEVQHITMLSVELHMQTRRDLCPDPSIDPINAIFYYLTCDTDDTKEAGIFILDSDYVPDDNATLDNSRETKSPSTKNETQASSSNRVAAVTDNSGPQHRKLLLRSGISSYVQRYYNNEKSMILDFVKLVRSRDPDIVIGYEVQMLSWGYLIERAREFDVNLCPLLSRIPSADNKNSTNNNADQEAFWYGHSLEFKITGRILLNIWRVMRSEVTLRVYSFENVVFHVLHERLPKYSYRTLSAWWTHRTSLHRWRVVEYYMKRCRANIDMLMRTDFISRTSELARLFGILFYSVISRGTQYRVESMMLRFVKPMGFIPVSPSNKQRAAMAAPECIPLVMEPESRFYTDPVIVLDFQSLYPSIIIAYNYCFSTCLGRVKHWNEQANFEFATTSLRIPIELLEKIKDDIHVSPCGVGFVKSNIRKGVLPRMLDDLLSTRIMVKNTMKSNKENKALYRMLDARQLGLKLIANVTYGYTSANFSGRMPAVEIADSVVRKARETLEVAIEMINTTKKWNARVVYGDTDSVFVLLKGATKERAFAVSEEIIKAVTERNPKPIKLKFEKVYMPCILQTKKRYVGYMYESVNQTEPVFDAKGIETVRRDSCAAVSKILESSLKTLFETRDVSLVKKYVQRQFTKIMEGRISIQDLTFAKEYRGMKNYRPSACVPALSIARRLLAQDKRAEPRSGERVPYVIVYGTPGLPLIQLVKRPAEVFEDPTLRPNALYYITKQIAPTLNRAFSLIGVDVMAWYNELAKPQGRVALPGPKGKRRKGTISQYFSSVRCPLCDEMTRDGLCAKCRLDPQTATSLLSYRINKLERKHAGALELCYHCTGSREQSQRCISHDCPVLHKLYHLKADMAPIDGYRELLEELSIG